MILLAHDCLMFELPSGESVPLSAEMISVEMAGEGAAAAGHDLDFLEHAAASVLHYFKHDLKCKTVTVAQFADAFETVLRGLGFQIESQKTEVVLPAEKNNDLRRLAHEAGCGGELVFFPRLRSALRDQIRRSPATIRFIGLRGCAKRLAGARRWSPRCETLRRQVVEYLRGCLSLEAEGKPCSLLVD